MHSFTEETRRRLRQQHCAMGYTPQDAALVVDLACSAYERALEVTHSVASLAPENRLMVASYHLAVKLLADSFTRLAAVINDTAQTMGAPSPAAPTPGRNRRPPSIYPTAPAGANPTPIERNRWPAKPPPLPTACSM